MMTTEGARSAALHQPLPSPNPYPYPDPDPDPDPKPNPNPNPDPDRNQVTDVISAEDRGTVEEDDDDDSDGSGGSGKAAEGKRNPLPFIGKGGLPLL